MNKMKAWQGSYGISPYTGIVGRVLSSGVKVKLQVTVKTIGALPQTPEFNALSFPGNDKKGTAEKPFPAKPHKPLGLPSGIALSCA